MDIIVVGTPCPKCGQPIEADYAGRPIRHHPIECIEHLRVDVKALRERFADLAHDKAELLVLYERERAENGRMRLTIGRLSAEVTQWSCVQCRFVYPNSPQPDLQCAVCPRCGGEVMPRNAAELRVLLAKNEQLREKLKALQSAQKSNEPLCGYCLSKPAQPGSYWCAACDRELDEREAEKFA